MGRPLDEKLTALLREGKDVVAARLFAECFTPDAQSPLEFRKIRSQLSSMAGTGRVKAFSVYGPNYTTAFELVLLWERAMLAGRLFAGDSATMYALLVSDGETARLSADPFAAALTAIRSASP